MCTFSCFSTIVGGCCNRIAYYSCYSSILGGGCHEIYSSCYASIIGGRCSYSSNSDYSTILGGCANCLCSTDYSSIIGGCCNIIFNSDYSAIIAGYSNRICAYYGSNDASTILGGCYNSIGGCGGDAERSSVIGGCNNTIICNSCNTVIIGGHNNSICCSSNSVILGGNGVSICGRNNTIFLNGTTWINQTVERAIEATVATSSYTADFNNGSVRYLSTISSDFQIDFTNFPDPSVENSVITYTLILNQSGTAYMITGLTINGGASETIKWANGNAPSGNANQVDTIGLMFVYDNLGNLVQILGQIGTFV
jgi:hypothetical protein